MLVDDASMYPWVYSLKAWEKSDANAAAGTWVRDIANIRARHVPQILIRDNAGELKNADLKAYIESLDLRLFLSGLWAISEWSSRILNQITYEFELNANGQVGINGQVLVSSSF